MYISTFYKQSFISDICEDSVKAYTEEDSEKLQPIIRFECRGLAPLEFSPRVGWQVVSTSDSATVFEDVNLGEGVRLIELI